ncbi:DotU family type IV/VI secretion system protein [Janthinobacterium sp. PC23-8]|uniref:DotU family type IV/VI secretion system protein n=1 Tax=Janthinobacterium sp. PC23-8 TaxID=2012679 RepID=UPI000B969E94|nr:DotU family type IV/VI secretion system protein [Janthinobacterium sp. PC23-8]OYO27459.1 hypothetical protein CD932_19960 [Janthinobacterium sp. PC23-8]
MTETPARHEPALAADGAGAWLFLGDCADFYEEIASLKRACAAEPPPAAAAAAVSPAQQARRASAHLLAMLRRQEQAFVQDASEQEIRARRVVTYLMAALADEIFLLELDWPGREAWLEVLLERQLFKTSTSGTRVFRLARDLTQAGVRGPLGAELAAVLLFMLALGFKGCYRGRGGEAALRQIRADLYRLLPASASGAAPAFGQAYSHDLRHGQDERLAPLSPWFMLAGSALAADLVLTLVVWLVLMYPFEQYIGA